MKNARVRIDTGVVAIPGSVGTTIDTLAADALLSAAHTSFPGHSTIVGIGLQINADVADFRQAGNAIARAGFAKCTVTHACFRAAAAIAWIVIEVRASVIASARGQTRVGATTISAGARTEPRIAIIAARAAIHGVGGRINTHHIAHHRPGLARAFP